MSVEIKSELIKALGENETISNETRSKRKQKIEEEKNRILNSMTGFHVLSDQELKEKLFKIATESAHKGGQQGRLTTGRHATHINYVDTANATDEFYYRTTDTHGGKVGYGKRQRKDAGGGAIRKK